MASLCVMARKKKLIAAAALASSPRSPPPAIPPSTDGPAQQLLKLNRFLVTETVELRKEVNLLRAELASIESGSLISIPASGSVPPPAEGNLDAEQVPAAERTAAPVNMEAQKKVKKLGSCNGFEREDCTVVPLHPEGRRMDLEEKFQGNMKKKKLIAAAALASSRRLPPPAMIDPSKDGPARQLWKLNRFLVTEKVELRKQGNLLRAKLASIESGPCISIPASSSVAGCASVRPPAEANLDAEQVAAAESTAAPVKSVDTVEQSEISSCNGVAHEDCTVVPLHPEEMFQKLEDEVFLLKKRLEEKNGLAAELSGGKTKSKWMKWIPATILLAAAAVVAYAARS